MLNLLAISEKSTKNLAGLIFYSPSMTRNAPIMLLVPVLSTWQYQPSGTLSSSIRSSQTFDTFPRHVKTHFFQYAIMHTKFYFTKYWLQINNNKKA